MSKQPWMKFYPADWRADPALRACSLGARGLWIDILTLMHEASTRGHLLINGSPASTAQLASIAGCSEADVISLMTELESAGIFSRKKNGVIFSRRMEKDENRARKNRENGKLGGNPTLFKIDENGLSDNLSDKAKKPETRDQITEDKSSVVDAPMAQTQKSKKGTRIPEGWEFGEPERLAAEKLGLDAARAGAEFGSFTDHWLQSSKPDAFKKDWLAAWRTWCRNAIRFAAERQSRFPPKPPDKPGNRGGFATILQENMDDLLRNFNDEQPQHYPDDNWRAEPEIIPPGGSDPRGFSAGGQDLRRDENRADGLSNVFDFRQARAYG